MNRAANNSRTALYFGLRVEVRCEIESYALIRFCGGDFVIDRGDLVADSEMALEQIETDNLSLAGSDCQKRMAASQK